MEKTISASEANRKFSELLRGVREGKSYVVTSHGKPLARIAPAAEMRSDDAKLRLIQHLRAQPIRNIGRWTRDELYK